MKATRVLHDAGQSIWLDNITREMLASGALKNYIDELSVTGLTSNPSIFNLAIKNSPCYDAAIRQGLAQGASGEDLFFDLALEDVTRAADLFLPIYEKTNTVDGWVSLEVSPLLAYNARKTLAVAKDLHIRAARPNLLIKIPGTSEGLPAVEEAIFSGIPVNITLLFSPEQYAAASEAVLRGLERRLAAGRNLNVGSVASVFVSRWDTAVAGKVADALKNKLGIAVARRVYTTAQTVMNSTRWKRLYNAGARQQRLVWASTGTKDPNASDILYVSALAAPFTVNTIPEATLKALATYTEIGPLMDDRGGDCEEVVQQFTRAGINIDSLAAQLQDEGTKAFVKAWNELITLILSTPDAKCTLA